MTPAPPIYDHALQLWKGAGARAPQFNLIHDEPSRCAHLAHDDIEVRQLRRPGVEANRPPTGVEAEWLGFAEAGGENIARSSTMSPGLSRYPVIGATHAALPAVSTGTMPWSGPMPAPRIDLGVDIIQNCEVTGLKIEAGRITGLETSRGTIRTPESRERRRGPYQCDRRHGGPAAADREPSVAGTRLGADQAGQSLCSLMSNAVHAYCSQSDKGELVIGAGIDAHPSPIPSAGRFR